MRRHGDVIVSNSRNIDLGPVETKELVLSGKCSLVEKEQATAVSAVTLNKRSRPTRIIEGRVRGS